MDIHAPRGTPVLAAAPGRVHRLRNTPAGGLSVYVADTAGTWMFYYAHLQGFRDGLSEGTNLAQGDVIGYVGTTGNAPKNVPHLHFQLMRRRDDRRWWDGEAVDPRPYFVVPGSQR